MPQLTSSSWVHSKSLVTDCDVDKSVWSGGGGNVSKTADCCDAHGLGLVGCEGEKKRLQGVPHRKAGNS
jgi:hypothetical protein